MKITIARKYESYGPVTGVHVEGLGRYAWVGNNGMGLGNQHIIYNAHWYDLRHYRGRYSVGDTRFAMFWKQLWRGLRAFVDTKRGYDGEY